MGCKTDRRRLQPRNSAQAFICCFSPSLWTWRNAIKTGYSPVFLFLNGVHAVVGCLNPEPFKYQSKEQIITVYKKFRSPLLEYFSLSYNPL